VAGDAIPEQTRVLVLWLPGTYLRGE
jgi:hypothetical protein